MRKIQTMFQEVGRILNKTECELGRNSIRFQGCLVTSIICRMAEVTAQTLLGYDQFLRKKHALHG